MKILEIIAPEGFQDIEYGVSKNIFIHAGHKVITASTKSLAKGALGSTQKADILLDQVKPEDYDVIVFIGGPGAPIYQDNKIAHEIAKRAKVLGAICIAPTILAKAGVLEGKRATVWNGDGKQEQILTKHGAKFTNEPVTVDKKIITANGPHVTKEFAEAILKFLLVI